MSNRLVMFLRQRNHVGRDRAIKRRDIATWIGCSIREVKALAEEARLAGEPVVYSTDSTSGGIFLAGSDQEIEEALGKLKRLALSILRERSAMKRALKKVREERVQTELFS